MKKFQILIAFMTLLLLLVGCSKSSNAGYRIIDDQRLYFVDDEIFTGITTIDNTQIYFENGIQDDFDTNMRFYDGKWYYLEKGVVINDLPSDCVDLTKEIRHFSPIKGEHITFYKDSDEIYNIQKTVPGDINILQISDTHIDVRSRYRERSIQAMQTVYDFVKQEKPDLIVMTGDLFFGMPYSNKYYDKLSLDASIKFFDAMEIPWIFVWGNHDHQFLDQLSDEEIAEIFNQSKYLLWYENDASVDRFSNNQFHLINEDGSINSILITIDTGDASYQNKQLGIVDTYDSITDNQIAWYESVVTASQKKYAKADLKSYVFMHMPTLDYETMWNDYHSGKSNITYNYGYHDDSFSGSTDNGKFISKVEELSSTNAVLCGHLHLNNYSLTKNNITYAFCGSIDHSATFGIQYANRWRGCTKITLNASGNATIRSIRYSDMTVPAHQVNYMDYTELLNGHTGYTWDEYFIKNAIDISSGGTAQLFNAKSKQSSEKFVNQTILSDVFTRTGFDKSYYHYNSINYTIYNSSGTFPTKRLTYGSAIKVRSGQTLSLDISKITYKNLWWLIVEYDKDGYALCNSDWHRITQDQLVTNPDTTYIQIIFKLTNSKNEDLTLLTEAMNTYGISFGIRGN